MTKQTNLENRAIDLGMSEPGVLIISKKAECGADEWLKDVSDRLDLRMRGSRSLAHPEPIETARTLLESAGKLRSLSLRCNLAPSEAPCSSAVAHAIDRKTQLLAGLVDAKPAWCTIDSFGSVDFEAWDILTVTIGFENGGLTQIEIFRGEEFEWNEIKAVTDTLRFTLAGPNDRELSLCVSEVALARDEFSEYH